MKFIKIKKAINILRTSRRAVGIICIFLIFIYINICEIYIKDHIIFQNTSRFALLIYISLYIGIISLAPTDISPYISSKIFKNNKFLYNFLLKLYKLIVISPLALLYLSLKMIKVILLGKTTIVLKIGFLVIKRKYTDRDLDNLVENINNDQLNSCLLEGDNKNILLNRIKENKLPFENQIKILEDFYNEYISKVEEELLASQPGFFKNIYNSACNFFDGSSAPAISISLIILGLIGYITATYLLNNQPPLYKDISMDDSQSIILMHHEAGKNIRPDYLQPLVPEPPVTNVEEATNNFIVKIKEIDDAREMLIHTCLSVLPTAKYKEYYTLALFTTIQNLSWAYRAKIVTAKKMYFRLPEEARESVKQSIDFDHERFQEISVFKVFAYAMIGFEKSFCWRFPFENRELPDLQHLFFFFDVFEGGQDTISIEENFFWNVNRWMGHLRRRYNRFGGFCKTID